MIRVNGSIDIERPPDEVFEFAVNPATSSQWQTKLESASFLTEPPIGVGSRLLHVRNYYGQHFESTAEISEFEPGRRYVAQDTEVGPFAVIGGLLTEPTARGTRVSYRFTLEPRGRVKLIEPIVGILFRREVTGDFRNLKTILESRQAPVSV